MPPAREQLGKLRQEVKHTAARGGSGGGSLARKQQDERERRPLINSDGDSSDDSGSGGEGGAASTTRTAYNGCSVYHIKTHLFLPRLGRYPWDPNPNFVTVVRGIGARVVWGSSLGCAGRRP